MDWKKYKRQFKKLAKHENFDEDYIDKYLNYARILVGKNLPIIYDQVHLSYLVGYDINYLLKASNAQSHFYRHFTIPKKSGKTRKISEPLPSLKEIQRWILDNILNKVTISEFSKAFIANRSIKDNAKFHVDQKHVLSLDVKDFFPSIKFYSIYNIFSNMGYQKQVSTMLSNLCVLNNCLPQGAPTSPMLSNILCKSIDDRLSKYAILGKIRYTRYADDITFSGNLNVSSIISFVSMVLEENGFKLNQNKTRLMTKNRQQEVTGIVVNQKMQAKREVRRKIRQSIYYINKFGLDSHLDTTKNDRANYINHLKGLANFVLFINPKDRDAQSVFNTFARNDDYQD